MSDDRRGENASGSGDNDSARQGDDEPMPVLERILGALGALVVLTLLAFLAYQALAVRHAGPELSAVATSIEPVGEQFLVHFRVENAGGEAAEGVQITGEVKMGGKTVEEASTTISFVPPNSFRRGVLVFTNDPHVARLDVRAAGYELP